MCSFIGLNDSIFLLYLWLLTSSWTAILICLEHSFWIAQQGSNSNDAFTKAWKLYLDTQHALVNSELDDYLMSKGRSDWFIMKYYPSEEECAECTKIILNNLLCKFSLCHPWAGIINIIIAYIIYVFSPF